jgi:hypothetical protein
MSTFTVAGVSTENGVSKVRFANDLVSRTKIMLKGGRTEVEFIELPRPMSKAEACAHLLDVGGVFEQFKDLITETMNKKVNNATPKVPKAPKVKVAPVQKTSTKIKSVEKRIKQEEKDDELLIKELGAALV